MSSETEPESPEREFTGLGDATVLPSPDPVKPPRSPKLTLLPPPTTPPRLPKRPNLSSATDVKRELGKLYRAGRHGLMPLEQMCKLTYVLTSIVKIIEAADFEQRLKALEQEEARHEHT